MPLTTVIADGGVSSLLACAAAGQRAAVGPMTEPVIALVPAFAESDPRFAAALAHAHHFGLLFESLQTPIAVLSDATGPLLHSLLEAALIVSSRGGGEVVWPVMATDQPDGGPDVAACAAAMNQATLISQLVTLTTCGSPVHVRTPYADLTGRQIADLVLDMDLPIWRCWWMGASEQEGEMRVLAIQERAKWTRLLKEAGWAGSLEAKAAVVVRSGVIHAPRTSGTSGGTP